MMLQLLLMLVTSVTLSQCADVAGDYRSQLKDALFQPGDLTTAAVLTGAAFAGILASLVYVFGIPWPLSLSFTLIFTLGDARDQLGAPSLKHLDRIEEFH